MPARLRNFIIERGGDFYRRLPCTDSAGASVDISSGYAASLIVSAVADDETSPLLALSSGSGLILGNGYLDIGVAKAALTALDLSALTRRGSLDEIAPNDEPDFVGVGRLAYYRLLLTGPASYDDDCLLRGQICFANR